MKELPSIQIQPIQSVSDCIPENNTENFLQTKLWGLFKAKEGWKAYFCSYRFVPDEEVGNLVVLRRRFARIFSFLYVPFGVAELELSDERWGKLAALGRATGRALGGRDIFIRFDLPWKRPFNPEQPELHNVPDNEEKVAGFRRGQDVQVPDTVILDISGTEDEILAQMKPKWRYNIRLAQKKGVIVQDEGVEGLDTFMDLYDETAHRDKIAIHPKSYYKAFFDTVSAISEPEKKDNPDGKNPQLSLYIARHEGIALAGIIVLHMGGRATYLYGASSNKERNLMPAYALQWYAILEARAKGAKSYDFFGVPPAGTDASHPMAGLYLFKTGFGGQVIHRYGAYDLSFHIFLHWLFRAGEWARILWFKKIKKTIGKMFRAEIERHARACGMKDPKTKSPDNQDSENTNPSNP